MKQPRHPKSLFNDTTLSLIAIFAIPIIFFGLGMACFYLISQSDPKVIANNGPCYETGIVAYVVDGDTVVMDDGRIIRYLGINTPETKNPDKPIECYGPEATIRNEEMVLGKQVELICGNENIDKYGRYFYQCTTDRGRLCSCISLWG